VRQYAYYTCQGRCVYVHIYKLHPYHARAARTRCPSGLSFQVCTTASEETLPNEGLTKQQLDVLLCPVTCRQRLQKHHDFLKVHFDELVGPFDEEGGADVEVEIGEATIFGLLEC
jgi:hypothetical protein